MYVDFCIDFDSNKAPAFEYFSSVIFAPFLSFLRRQESIIIKMVSLKNAKDYLEWIPVCAEMPEKIIIIEISNVHEASRSIFDRKQKIYRCPAVSGIALYSFMALAK